MMNRWIAVVLSLFLLIAAGIGGLYFAGVIFEPNGLELAAKEYRHAQELLKNGNTTEALMLVDKYAHLPPEQIKSFKESGQDWHALELSILLETRSIPRLFYLLSRSPESFNAHEDVVLSLGVLLVRWERWDEYDKLRQPWKGREKDHDRWFLLDADYMVANKSLDEAVKHLESRQFEGKKDIARLIRLALAYSKTQVKMSWKYLSEAFRLDPKNTEVRAFRAQILDHINQPHMARFEYTAALMANPEDPMIRDQLAEFYRRHQNYEHALATWKVGIEHSPSDLMWLRVGFWSRLVLPVDVETFKLEVPEGDLQPLAQLILGLEEEQFWDEEAFRNLPESAFYDSNRQEVFWLRLVDLLDKGREPDALRLLEANAFAKSSWAPRMENAIKQILNYRLNGTISAPLKLTAHASHPNEQPPHLLFYELDQLARETSTKADLEESMSEHLRQLLLSEEVWSAVFIAEGWREVGLKLHRLPRIPEAFPEWVAYGFIQSTAQNRGVEKGLEVARRQTQTALVEMIQSELLVSTGDLDSAERLLKRLSAENNLVGFRSSLLLSNVYIDQKRYAEARTIIKSNASLREHLVGKEQMARLAQEEGNFELADNLYEEIKDNSFSARVYLARRAYDKKDYDRAEELTLELIKERPDFLPLRSNLREIRQARAEAEGFKVN